MTTPAAPLLATLTVAIATTFASCAVYAEEWRQAKVRSISTRAEVDPRTDFECAPQRADGNDQRLLVVSYRVGRATRWRAFEMPANEDFALGEEIDIDVPDCRIKHLPHANKKAPSAP